MTPFPEETVPPPPPPRRPSVDPMKIVLGAALAVSLAAIPVIGVLQSRVNKAQGSRLADCVRVLERERNEFEKKYRDIETDRNNILEQTKGLLGDRQKLVGLQESYDELLKTNEIMARQKDKIHRDLEKIKEDMQEVAGHFDRLKTNYVELQGKSRVLENENEQLRQAMTRRVESTPIYQKLDKETRALRSNKAALEGQVKGLEGKIKQITDRIKRIQDRDKKFAKQADGLVAEIRRLKAENDKLTKTNAAVNQVAQEAPSRFSAIAEENKALRRETADMHYNLSVFFTENRNWPRAVKELERSIEIFPDNPRAHYNLGYLYAEQFQHHQKALAHFNRFLQLSPHAKESEAVRSYILTQESLGERSSAIRVKKA